MKSVRTLAASARWGRAWAAAAHGMGETVRPLSVLHELHGSIASQSVPINLLVGVGEPLGEGRTNSVLVR